MEELVQQQVPAENQPSRLARIIKRLAWCSLICVYLVITAGSTVRATGSGMGCPDWPTCYGYLIPPTSAGQVTWSPNRSFSPGQMIIHVWDDGESAPRERLLVAQAAFTTTATFHVEHWAPYERHDYAIFNPVHTWIEFINRLLGALSGWPMLALFACAMVAVFREKAWLTGLWATGSLSILLFVAWLGKLVVDGNLIPGSITIHMFGSIFLVMTLILLIRQRGERVPVSPLSWWLICVSFILIMGQIALGTQVREEVDFLVKEGVLERNVWVQFLSSLFEVHRSVSWLIAALIATWFVLLWRGGQRCLEMYLVVALVLLQVVVGVVLDRWAFPAVMQPVHLVGAIVLIGVSWSLLLKVQNRRSN